MAARRHQVCPPCGPAPAWRLRGLSVCASTELELDRWLASDPPPARHDQAGAELDGLRQPMAVLARRQRFGHGQRGRPWSSPEGGVWLSAALPWPAAAAAAPGLAVAVGLALQLESLAVAVRLKWPNDLMLEGRKLAGLLPRLRLRGGRIRWARVGVGLNGRNAVPPGATNLVAALGAAGANPQRLSALVLASLEWAMAWSDCPEAVRELAEHRLLLPAEPVWEGGEAWRAIGLAANGGLVLANGGRRQVLLRRF